MSAVAQEQEKELSLKTFQTHVIKTVVGSVIAAVVIMIGTAFGFYYKTKNQLDNHENRLNNMSVIVNKHDEEISTNNSATNVSDLQFKNLDKRISTIEERQEAIFELLIEISSNQKSLMRNSNN